MSAKIKTAADVAHDSVGRVMAETFNAYLIVGIDVNGVPVSLTNANPGTFEDDQLQAILNEVMAQNAGK